MILYYYEKTNDLYLLWSIKIFKLKRYNQIVYILIKINKLSVKFKFSLRNLVNVQILPKTM